MHDWSNQQCHLQVGLSEVGFYELAGTLCPNEWLSLVTPWNEDISGQHGQMIWSNKLFSGIIGSTVFWLSVWGPQSDLRAPLALLCAHLHALRLYQKGTKVCPPPVPAVVSHRYSSLGTAHQPTLLINHFAFCCAIFKPVQFPNPARWAAAQTLLVQTWGGEAKRHWGLHQLALLFKGVLHVKANQILNCNSNLDITTGRLVCLA